MPHVVSVRRWWQSPHTFMGWLGRWWQSPHTFMGWLGRWWER